MRNCLTESDLPDLELIARGKVRELYKVGDSHLLFIATDRISAFDVIMKTPIEGKGKILTQLSTFWFDMLKDIVPNHFVTANIDEMPEAVRKYKDVVDNRCLLVKKLTVLPIEAIVRGYISGSAWKEYSVSGTVNGIQMPENLRESQKLASPIYTPSTKAELGEHDMNIHPDQVKTMIGEELANKVEQVSIQLYKRAAEYALKKGIIIADTKFEFGTDENGDLYLIDEVLTPDSSRFWPLSSYKVGKPQNSYDKQYLRDYLDSIDYDHETPIDLPPSIVDNTLRKYIEAYVSSTDVPFTFPGEDENFSLDQMLERIKIKIYRVSPTEMEFDLIGVDSSIANALRRILISEIPTIAIEKVYMLNNTGVVQDEVLSHRLGLIPIKADPREFTWKESTEDPTDQNTIVFKLQVQCSKNPKASKNETDPAKKYLHSSVYSRDLVWDPRGDQEQRFGVNGIRPVHDDILITKLRPGQQISCELHCHKGIGRDHAKFSPVCTASYRLMPHIEITKEIVGKDAVFFQSCFPKGVIDLVENENGKLKAVVANPRNDTVSREVLRHEQFVNKVKLERIRDHFIFNIESTGAISPPELLHMAIEILASKSQNLKQSISSLINKS
ncbi:hypothetical protein BB559_002566 [Furculomyces boomerangus]|uniref:DNA-directed RNA polymerases I and III subunit RPAC1 n=2 Tax=Harpellales TaxID=61421 RepID=A0A2T9YUA7_9FUNG|nr:hypothetical protein BB559_002566 [Furculomyces boomerangus]PWA03134.1 hypothetical protein BB558_000701 [Smittium angustum]